MARVDKSCVHCGLDLACEQCCETGDWVCLAHKFVIEIPTKMIIKKSGRLKYNNKTRRKVYRDSTVWIKKCTRIMAGLPAPKLSMKQLDKLKHLPRDVVIVI